VVKTRFAHGVPFSAKADSALPGVAAFLNATSSIRATFVSSSRRLRVVDRSFGSFLF
jgi:hypothetical protein